MATFKATIQTLESVRARTFLLENVDLEDAKDSNLDIIVQMLEELNFSVFVFKILSSDYGVPQRRVRLFFLGVNKGLYPNFDQKNVIKHLAAFQLKCQTADTC